VQKAKKETESESEDSEESEVEQSEDEEHSEEEPEAPIASKVCLCVLSLHLVAWSLETELTHMRHGRSPEGKPESKVSPIASGRQARTKVLCCFA
jgi:hypothetical protein